MAPPQIVYDRSVFDSPAGRILQGTVQPHGMFKFVCGFEIPLYHVEWVIGRKLNIGDKVTVQVIRPVVESHQHSFKCPCGATHS